MISFFVVRELKNIPLNIIIYFFLWFVKWTKNIHLILISILNFAAIYIYMKFKYFKCIRKKSMDTDRNKRKYF